MNTNENVPHVENPQSEVTPSEWEGTIKYEDTRPLEWVPAGTTVAQAVDNLTHVVAKLLQAHMLIQKSLEDISKSIERIAR